MSELRTLTEPELEALLEGALESRCSASLRADDSVRMLGQLRLEELAPGAWLSLVGAKHRDQLPPAGTAVTLSLILGDQAVAIRTRMLEPVAALQSPPVLRAAWPTQPLEFHRRADVRVANPALPPLEATLVHRGQRVAAKVLNLTETGMGLGLTSLAQFVPQEEVAVETCLPGGEAFRVTAQVRHFEVLEDDDLPTRLGLILLDLPQAVREALRSQIQARRMYLSQDLREG